MPSEETAHTIKLPDCHFHVWLKQGSSAIFTSANPTAVNSGHVKHVRKKPRGTYVSRKSTKQPQESFNFRPKVSGGHGVQRLDRWSPLPPGNPAAVTSRCCHVYCSMIDVIDWCSISDWLVWLRSRFRSDTDSEMMLCQRHRQTAAKRHRTRRARFKRIFKV